MDWLMPNGFLTIPMHSKKKLSNSMIKSTKNLFKKKSKNVSNKKTLVNVSNSKEHLGINDKDLNKKLHFQKSSHKKLP